MNRMRHPKLSVSPWSICVVCGNYVFYSASEVTSVIHTFVSSFIGCLYQSRVGHIFGDPCTPVQSINLGIQSYPIQFMDGSNPCPTLYRSSWVNSPYWDPLWSIKSAVDHPRHLELLIKFEGQSDDITSTMKALKQLSSVEELTVLAERTPHNKGWSMKLSIKLLQHYSILTRPETIRCVTYLRLPAAHASCLGFFASEMAYIVSSGALKSTHSPCLGFNEATFRLCPLLPHLAGPV